MYDPHLVQPMRDELTSIGVKELRTPEEVDATMREPGTTLVFVNSVCGCAAGSARPGVALALEKGDEKPDRVATVFAGQDVEATARARAAMPDIPPSSPSIAYFKDGELVFFLPRHRIEGRTAQDVANDLTAVFDEHAG